MAHTYAYSLASDGSKDFTTYAALNTQMVADWGADDFDADVVVEVFHVAAFTGQWIVTATLDPTMRYPLIIKAAAGHSPVINATGNAYGFYCSAIAGHTRFIGIEVYGATASNCISKCYLSYYEGVNSHDCAAIADHLFYAAANTYMQLIDCECSGVGHIYIAGASLFAARCSFAGGSAAQYLFRLYRSNTRCHFTFYACAFDGSDLDAGVEIMQLQAANDLTDNFPEMEFLNCIAQGAGWLVSQETANEEAPSRFRVINSIFLDFDTGVFNLNGGPKKPDEGGMYELEANDFWNSGNWLVDANGTYTSLAELQAAGYDTLEKSIDTDPKETSPFDGTVESDSPGIEKGIGAGVLLGLNGNSFALKNQRPSIGADAQYDTDAEFGSPGAPSWNGALVPGVTQVTLPITVAAPGDTVKAYYRLRDSEDVFTAGIGRTGDGNIVQTGLTAGAYYDFIVLAYLGAAFSLPTQIKVSSPYGAGDMDKVLLRKSPVWANVLTRVDNPGWT